MPFDFHSQNSTVFALSAKNAALESVPLCCLTIFASGLDLKLLWGDYRDNMMSYLSQKPRIVKEKNSR
jgi:hypothetical protein